ncbi:MAG: alpha/beta fold hydrolase [Paracoccaceae bacterium]
MADFLLIHGSCHGAWCWRDLIPQLEAHGHTARAIDLPGHGADRTHYSEVTLERYAQAIIDAIDTPVALVGHSMAGFPISLAAEMAPQKIASLIYLCAYAAQNGRSLVEMRAEAPRQPMADAALRTQDGLAFSVDPAKAPSLFYNDCPAEAVEFALPRLCLQALAPQTTPIRLGAAYARVKRSYIRCDDDRTIPREYQLTMTQGWPASDVYAMPTGHSPFFADPAGLADLLTRIAKG